MRVRSDGILYWNLAAIRIKVSLTVQTKYFESFTSSRGNEEIRFQSLRGYDQRYSITRFQCLLITINTRYYYSFKIFPQF